VVPVGGRVPLQPPEAVQALALAAFHCRLTDEPMSTLLSLAFNVSDGGGTTALLVPVASTVCECEEEPHAASALSAANPNIDFNANAVPKQRLRRIELITRLPGGRKVEFPPCLLAFATISEITYSFDMLKLPTCRHLQTTYV
jgi:hypothetical protein